MTASPPDPPPAPPPDPPSAERRPAGRVVLAGAPLGRATDASAGLARALATAPLIAAEDTRRLHRLATELGVAVSGRVL